MYMLGNPSLLSTKEHNVHVKPSLASAQEHNVHVTPSLVST